ncbi:hypothetical protein JXM83_05740 [Candidatus Woesearchaeota archaeon]|nr:hypothetical protein [Candidatus Woesearchaeota archaeon]
MINVNKEEFLNIAKDYDAYDLLREDLIACSRLVLKESKKLIFGLNRNSDVNLDDIKKSFDSMNSVVAKNDILLSEGSYSIAVQEYVEAVVYYYVVRERRVPSKVELNVPDELYMLGICDLAGELTRYAVNSSISGQYDVAVEMRDFLSDLYSILLEFNPRNGNLRKKIDGVKWELRKIEDLILSNKKN